MGTDVALVAVLADTFAEYRHTVPALQTTPAKTRDTPETANLKTDAAMRPRTLPVVGYLGHAAGAPVITPVPRVRQGCARRRVLACRPS